MATDPQTERAAARVGTTLKGKWRLDHLLGVGGMAAVYGATHRNGKRVAIKMLHPEISFDGDIRQRFLREGYVANAVRHPGAVTVDDDDTDEAGSAFLVMELLYGETLDARMQRKGGKLPTDEVLSLVDQVLSTIEAAHAKGIVHRDLKPENLFLTEHGTVKVLDFGIARLRELSGNSSATQAGAMMGTPAFMPPEQASSRWDEVDTRTDLWALGATMFTLLTGHHVHEAGTMTEALAMAVLIPPRSLAAVDATLPPAVVQLVDRALARDKAARWPDAAAMREAVRAAYHTLAAGAEPEAHRLSIADDGGVPAPAMAAAGTRTGSGVSATVHGNAAVPDDELLRSARPGPILRPVPVAVVAGVAVLLGTILLFRGGADDEGNGTAATASSAGSAVVPAGASMAPGAEGFAQKPEHLPLEPSPTVTPASEGAAAKPGAREDKKATASQAPASEKKLAQPAAAPSVPAPAAGGVKIIPVVLDDEVPQPSAPAPKAKPKVKGPADSFTGRY